MKTNIRCVLVPSAVLVKGASRCLICDLEQNSYSIIPDMLYNILSDHKSGFIINEIISKYSGGDYSNESIILDYFKFMVKSDLLLFTDFPEYYSTIDLKWDYPGMFSNAVIDIAEDTEPSILFLDQVARLGCRFVQIRFFENKPLENIYPILNSIQDSIIEAIEIIMPYYSESVTENVASLLERYNRVRTFSLFNAPDNFITYKRTNGFGQVVMIKSELKNETSCGFISHNYFVANSSTFTEALAHNSCLNRKISIDVDGNIKNCPSMSQSFGNIKDTTLQEALDHPDFKKYWNVTKDQIAVCKDCEFRYICTDCRAYIENPEDMYSKPLKCGYNPYTCEWEEWSTNPLKQKAIDYYGMREVLPEFKMKPDYVPSTPSDAT